MQAFGSINAGPWKLVEVVASHDAGKSLLVNGDGSIVSVQPDGSIQSRPPGTDGAWEQCVISGGIALFAGTGQCWPFGIRQA